MALSVQRYTVPPRGVRPTAGPWTGNFTRRDPQTGPYGIFIRSESQSSLRCHVDDVDHYRSYWEEATGSLRDLLWGSSEARRRAVRKLESLNRRISRSNRNHNHDPGTAVIEIANWRNAGEQLDLSVRDYHCFHSTARFEDVRDFIWERVQNMNYPTDWEVMYCDFEQEIERTASYYDNLRRERGLDPDDSAFHELTRDGSPTEHATQIGASRLNLPLNISESSAPGTASSRAHTQRRHVRVPAAPNGLQILSGNDRSERQPLAMLTARQLRSRTRRLNTGQTRHISAITRPAPSFRRRLQSAVRPGGQRIPLPRRRRVQAPDRHGSQDQENQANRPVDYDMEESPRMRQWLNLR